jgi:hypothetical protein
MTKLYIRSSNPPFKPNLFDFLANMELEVMRARELFPSNEMLFAAVMEEAGEVARAVIELERNGTALAKGKPISIDEFYTECIQLAAMAARLALEGDPLYYRTLP